MPCGAGYGPQLRCCQRDPVNWHTLTVQTRYRNGLAVGRLVPAMWGRSPVALCARVLPGTLG